MAAAGALCAAQLASAGLALAGTASSWGIAHEVPGSANLNAGGHAGVDSVSCATPGNCAATGHYTSASGHQQAFIVSQSGGTWGAAQEIPGTAALDAGGHADAVSVSCTATASCSAGGYYTDSAGHPQAFVVSETSGTWGTAQEVPGTAALNAGGSAAIASVACSAPGTCGAGGYYTDSSGHRQAFVVTEKQGTWGSAEEVPGTAALNAGGSAAIASVSCAAPGSCGAGGNYASSSSDGIATQQAFVVNESKGTWGTAQEVPGTAALNAGGSAGITAVSCIAVGTCAAGGDYTTKKPATEALVVDETNGVWRTAKEVPGTGALNKRGLAQVNALSCVKALACSAGGFYQNASFEGEAFVVGASGGTWHTASEVPGTAVLNAGGLAAIASVSCVAAGNCSAGGSYTDSSGFAQAFVVSESKGAWKAAEEVPGTGALNVGASAGTTSVSCASVTVCSAGGSYTATKSAGQAFVVGKA
ncbi:MAG TPA: hypothetical protein VGH27_21880 [Streptosporangiaceae bacterium]